MRLRTIRKLEAKRAGESWPVLPQNSHARRMIWHEQFGSKDRKGLEQLVDFDFGFKEEDDNE